MESIKNSEARSYKGGRILIFARIAAREQKFGKISYLFETIFVKPAQRTMAQSNASCINPLQCYQHPLLQGWSISTNP